MTPLPPAGDSPRRWDTTIDDHKNRQADAIVAAALTIVAERGMTGLTMSAIAGAAGIARQTLYRYHADVEAVLASAVARQNELARAHLTALFAHYDSPPEQIAAFVAECVAAPGHGHPITEAAGLSPAVRQGLHQHEAQATDLVADVLRRGVARGDFRPDLDPVIDATLVRQAVVGAIHIAADHPDPGLVTAVATRTILTALGTAAGAIPAPNSHPMPRQGSEQGMLEGS